MSIRSVLSGLAISAVAATAVSTIATPAHADPSFVPDANDIVGVGSDTTELLMNALSEGYNTGKNTSAPLMASFDVAGTADIVLRSGSAPIPRPVGSGAGIRTLYSDGSTAVNNTDVTFARSSSALSSSQAAGGTTGALTSFPFAKDSLLMAVAPGSNAPDSLTIEQVLGIYNGTYTNWNQLGGVTAPIKAYLPQSGSGTRSFFESTLKAANGGTAVTIAPGVVQGVYENNDCIFHAGDGASCFSEGTPVANDPINAVAPFSAARQRTVYPTTVSLLDGFEAARAVYNVVRVASLSDATLGPVLSGIFGPDGYLCSEPGKAIIEDEGFEQLRAPTGGGACGTQVGAGGTTNLVTSLTVPTVTLSTSNPAAGALTLNATLSPAAAQGTVTFSEGATELGSAAVVSGVASWRITGATAGKHTYSAHFTPTVDSAFDEADAPDLNATIAVKGTISESFPAKINVNKKAVGTVKVKAAGTTAKGKVTITKGKKTLVKGNLKAGKVKLTLPKLNKGKHTLKITYAGSASVLKATKSFTIKSVK